MPVVVVGYETKIGGADTAFIWDAFSGTQDLNSLMDSSGAGWVLQVARDINNNGTIVGYGLKDGAVHGFAAIPVPEPVTLSATLAAMSMAILRRRR